MNRVIADVVHLGDCVDGMAGMEAGCADLIFADPPFNIGYDYDVYDDRKAVDVYLEWSKVWGTAAYRVLKPDGTLWLAIGDEMAAELKVLFQSIGFHTRSWVIWYYTFGVNCSKNFTRSHTHLLYFVKDTKRFTFNVPAIKVPSARQAVYRDARAKKGGRLPDNTWILRPQDWPGLMESDEDTWHVPRVAGTFRERSGFHGCQMPGKVLDRIVRACSRRGELVLDPMVGTGTTLAVAKQLGRRWVGWDVSQSYVAGANTRIAAVTVEEE